MGGAPRRGRRLAGTLLLALSGGWSAGCRSAPRASASDGPAAPRPPVAAVQGDSTGPDSTRAGDSTAAATPPERVAPGGAPDTATTRRRPKIDPSTALRFEIVAVEDSTFRFVAPSAGWAQAGARGIAVDPRRRDALVAAFDALERRADTVVALVTGQTARVTTDHVVLLERPPLPPAPRRRRDFWRGLGTGATAGAVIGLVTGLLIR